MPLTLEHDPSELPATGGRALRTTDNGGGSFSLSYTAKDTAGHNHEGTATNTAIATWIIDKWNNGGSALVDAVKQANPGFDPATDLATARALLFIACDRLVLGFDES